MTAHHKDRKNLDTIYTSEAFSLWPNAVKQGRYKAIAVSSETIVSDYVSPASLQYANRIAFKISINLRDLEAPIGEDHFVMVAPDDHESPVIVFGEMTPEPPADLGVRVKPNHPYTFRIDMRPVLRQFEDQGYFEAYDGSRIARQDFRGFYLAGGSRPLSWDFANLDKKNLKLSETHQPGIYSVTVLLNPYDPSLVNHSTWKLERDISAKPNYMSDQPLVDALYKMATSEALQNIEVDQTLRTGAKWSGVWTRDISYSIYLAFAYHEPEIAKISLMKKVKHDRIVQDTGSGGAWPVSTDRTVWAIAAWEIYLISGDKNWLENCFPILKNTLEDDAKTLTTPSGLYKGESSFLDWREQTYPKWMSCADIAVSLNLGTNVVHYQAYVILAKMARALGKNEKDYQRQAVTIKKAINKFLWQPENGYYAQYLYGRNTLSQSPRFEALGEALAVLFDVASETQADSIVSRSPLTPFGATSIYPQISGMPPYHNDGVWPFVQAYFNLAAAKTGNEKVLNHGLACLYRPAALFLSHYENFVAQNGDYQGTEVNSHRMLWSIAGNLAMVHRVFLGMHFEENGIRFKPVIPKSYDGKKRLEGFKYRNATLDIEVRGCGNQIASITFDGKKITGNFLTAEKLQTNHKVVIQMANIHFAKSEINLVENKYSLRTPMVKLDGKQLWWKPVSGAVKYSIFRNGKPIGETQSSEYVIAEKGYAEYQVMAIHSEGHHSFLSEPVVVFDWCEQIQLERIAKKSKEKQVNFSGKGFIETSNSKNRKISIPVTVPKNGKYRLDFRYANGSGPISTGSRCAIRSLYVNSNFAGTLVFPQRGEGEWSDWGFSNGFTVSLNKGENMVELQFKPWDNNMDREVNRALLDYLRVIRVK
ncbi:MAG: amylo-alpha-1,6-glucosidase [Leeuwenhoekiella sp.]